jgi:acid phosphatase (class A)
MFGKHSNDLSPRGIRTGIAFLALLLTLGGLQAASFIKPAEINVKAILPPPPVQGSEEYRIDTGFLKNARATATKSQLRRGIAASKDSVFDFQETLGRWFNATNLPKTAALFQEVTDETKEAIEVAKHTYGRVRPETWKETGDPENSNGYAYPSGHTTRAFVWANLLADALPSQRQALHKQARQKAWYRVILGRHFPADVRAGKLYGQYLAKQFLRNPQFQSQWKPVVAELKTALQTAMDHPPHPIIEDAPASLNL